MHTGTMSHTPEEWQIGYDKLFAFPVVGASTIGIPATGWIIKVGREIQINITRYPKNTYIAYRHPACDNPHPKLKPGWSAWKGPIPNTIWDKARNDTMRQLLAHLDALSAYTPDYFDDYGMDEMNDWHPGHPSHYGDK
jgi:hypothetical protein